MVQRALRRPSSLTEAMFGWIACFLALWLFTFWSLVLRARLSMGEWPHPQRGYPFDGSYQPSTVDPKVFPLHDLAVWAGLIVLVLLLPIVVILLLTTIFVPSRRPSRQLSIAILVLTTLVGVTVFLDPHRFMLWFVD